VARGAARKRFVALAPTRDENDRERLPSPFLLGLPSVRGASTAELKDRSAAAGHGIRRVPLGILLEDPVAIDADEAFRVALFRRASLARSPLAPAALGPALGRADLRLQPRFTAYEGRLGRRTDLLSLADRILSATLLESLATCPYRTLLEKGLHLEEVKEPVSPLVPDARALGAMAHEVLRDVTRELIEHGRSFTWQPEALGARAETLARTAVARWMDESGADPPPALVERTARHLSGLVREILRHEREALTRPAGAEVRFGRKKGPAADPDLSREEAVTLEADGRVFLLEGQIDRIDREGETALVVDYKFGKSKPYEKTNKAGHLLAQGERLQLPVYALAARALGAAEISSAYLFVPSAGKAVRILFDAPRTEEAIAGLGKAVGSLARAVKKGDFLPKPDGVRSGKGDNCKYCAMADVCGGGHLVVFERKWETDGGSTPLAELKEIR
jgi:RecB family exonuclease